MFAVLSEKVTYSQEAVYPRDYFRAPVDFRMLLSATFGEFRADHFHSGIDIRTGGVEGKPIYAIADGYVSRIKITSSGYGKAIYVSHPNGFVSVYGHLSSLETAMNQYIFEKQYEQHAYQIDVSPDRSRFPVTRGQVIAYSGNSGYSFGPHLHFEIRSEKTQQPVNPLLFGLPVKDIVRPVLTSLKVYSMDTYSTVNGKNDNMVIALEQAGQGYRLAGPDTLKLKGNISFGLSSYDLLSDVDRKNGIYSAELFMDGEEVFNYSTTTFSFDETRYINSLYDYREYKTTGQRYLRTAVDPNNKFKGYEVVKNDGIIYFDDDKIHELMFFVKDVNGNASQLLFYVQGQKMTSIQPYQPFPEKFDSFHFMYYLPNTYETNDFKVEIPSGALYTNLVLEYSATGPLKNTLAKVHRVHNRFTPLHKSMILRIRPLEKAKGLEDKLYMVSLNDDGTMDAIPSYFEDGFVVGRSAQFGNFSLLADTVKPTVKLVNFYDKKSLAGMKELRIEIKDNQSGIESYTPTLNGEWILMEYDEKNDLLIYRFDRYLLKGTNVLRIEVSDRKNNTRVVEARVTY
ncbi:MAG: M23 family metallopeptidase [Bacteroidales bacterium]|nr:M23 family metallopeptidase [Lentimicrobiaceae bacterium]MDD5694012.1 M23 family metallopeptidase [Bacteroidales bacterium]